MRGECRCSRAATAPVARCHLFAAGARSPIANTIAYTSELLDPVSIFLGLTQKSSMTQSCKYLLLGEGETGIMVYQILSKFWRETPENDVQPLIFLMSE